jgi:hypothetical protein
MPNYTGSFYTVRGSGISEITISFEGVEKPPRKSTAFLRENVS